MIAAVLLGLAAAGGDLRDLCPDRPGRLTPACIVDPRHLLVETAVDDFTHDAAADVVTDTTAVASTLLRFGVTQHLELLAGWTPFIHQRARVLGEGVERTDGVGDVTLGVKQSLLHPDGKGFSLALQPFVVVPTARAALGVGSPVVGLIVPVTVALPAGLQLGLSPEIDRVANQGDRGHHASYTLIGGLSRAFGAVTPGVEFAVVHDDDPTGRTTKATADLFAAYIPKAHPNLQLDASAYIGLNRDTPDVEVMVGVARRF